MTTVRLNDNVDKKLSILTDFEKTTKTEIIKKAINEYFAAHIQEKTPYELGKDLFGRHGDDPDLSTSYKNKLKGFLNEKHSH